MDAKEQKKFSLRERIKSSNHAWRGIGILFKTSYNAQGLIFFGILAIYLGFILKISSLEWVVLAVTIGIVIITEALNEALEIDINLTSPEYHPYARDTKDVAAGAVLIAVILSLVVAFIIFIPKIYYLL